MDVSTGMGWRYPGTILQLCDLICQHRFGADGVDIAHTRKEENLDEGNNNGLERHVRVLEQLYTNKDWPRNSPSLEVSLR